MLLDATQALKRIFDRVDPFLKDDLLRGMVELLTGEPTPMRQRPVAATTVNPVVPEEERKKLLTAAFGREGFPGLPVAVAAAGVAGVVVVAGSVLLGSPSQLGSKRYQIQVK